MCIDKSHKLITIVKLQTIYRSASIHILTALGSNKEKSRKRGAGRIKIKVKHIHTYM